MHRLLGQSCVASVFFVVIGAPACTTQGQPWYSEADLADSGGHVEVPDPQECSYHAQCASVGVSLCEDAKCRSGRCVVEPKPTWAACSLSDAGECERGVCNDQADCVAVTAHDGAVCGSEKWNACFGFNCVRGACEETALVNCDDSNPCTDDSCDPDVGCSHVYDPAGDCSAVPVAPCQAANCHPDTGSCEPEPVSDGTTCDDEDPETLCDRCEDGTCVGAADPCE